MSKTPATSNGQDPRIHFRPGKNDAYCRASVTRRIIPYGEEKFDLPLTPEATTNLNNGTYAFPVEFVKFLSKIDGIKRIWIEPYAVAMLKADAFDWDPMQDALVEAFLRLFPKEDRDGVDVEWRMNYEEV